MRSCNIRCHDLVLKGPGQSVSINHDREHRVLLPKSADLVIANHLCLVSESSLN